MSVDAGGTPVDDNTQPIEMPPVSPGAQAAPSTLAAAQPPRSAQRIVLWTSIGALGFMTAVSIAALFVESVEGRGGRLFATLLLFGVFVGLTALDQARASVRDWYGPAAVVSNVWLLSASLVTIWFSPDDPYFGSFFVVVWPVLAVSLLTRLALLFSMLMLGKGVPPQGAQGLAAQASSWLLVGSAFLYTSEIAVRSAFGIRIVRAYGWEAVDAFWEMWTRVGTAALLLAAMAASVSLLLRWQASADRRAARAAHPASGSVPVAPATPPLAPMPPASSLPSLPPVPPVRQQDQQLPYAPVSARTLSPTSQVLPVARPEPAPRLPSSVVEPLPWPVFPDGSPYPVGADGQPDFTEAGRIMASRTGRQA